MVAQTFKLLRVFSSVIVPWVFGMAMVVGGGALMCMSLFPNVYEVLASNFTKLSTNNDQPTLVTRRVNPERAGAAVQDCVDTSRKISGPNEVNVKNLPETSAEWAALISLAATTTNADPLLFVDAICGELSKASADMVRTVGSEGVAFGALQSATRAKVAKEVSSAPKLTISLPDLPETIYDLPEVKEISSVDVNFSVLCLGFLLLGAIWWRLVVIQKKVAAIHEKSSSDTTTKLTKGLADKAEQIDAVDGNLLARRTLSATKDLNERGIYVAAADVELEKDPKVIVLVVANATPTMQRASAYFSFFNTKGKKVGDLLSAPFLVPAQGIFNLRTVVPHNDGTWTKWRSEIRVAE